MYLRKEVKFVLFGSGRNGSNLLKNLIKSHPEIFCDGELFNTMLWTKYPAFLRSFWMKNPMSFISYNTFRNSSNIYGFKLMSYQYPEISRLIKNLADSNWKFIFLTRKNKLSQALSFSLAEKTNQWVRWKFREPPTEKHNLVPEEVIKHLNKLVKQDALEENLMQQVDHLKIFYETDLLKENFWENTMSKVFGYLNTFPAQVFANNRVVDPRPDNEKISNFDEIISALKLKGYSKVVDYYFSEI